MILSLLAHGLPALLLSSLALLEKLMPPPPVTWEIVPAKPKPPSLLTPQQEAVAPVEPQAPPEKPKPIERGNGQIGKPKPVKESKAPKLPGLRSLHGVGPESIEQDLGLRLLLRLPEVARSSHRQAVAGLLGAFPDSRLLTAGSGIASGEGLADALFQSAELLVIATTDPSGQRRSQTALLALGRKLDSVYQQLTSRRVPTWDDRELLFDGGDLLAFLPKPQLSSLPESVPPDAGTSPSPPSLREQLPALRRSLPRSGPPLVAEIFNTQLRLRLRGGIPTPRQLQLALSADPDPQVHGRFVLGSTEEATRFRESLLQVSDKLRSDWRFKLMGFSTVTDHLTIEAKDSDVIVTGFVTASALHALLGAATGALQILPSGAPPPPPDLLPPPLLDAGVSDGSDSSPSVR